MTESQETILPAKAPWPTDWEGSYLDNFPTGSPMMIIEPSRLCSTLWGYSEGDIYAAYCADTFPRVKTFTHNDQLYANMGGGETYCTCFPLVPLNLYQGPPSKPHSYEGESVTFKGKNYRLGTKTIFASRKWTLGESVDLLRRKYAYGGHFASQKSYRQVLLTFLSRPSNSPQMVAAIESELNQLSLPSTQNEMAARFGKQPDEIKESETTQPALPGF